jgi:hypothetical protein
VYNPTIGRWMTRDPLQEAGGVDVYAFNKNDPINNVDADGLDPHSVQDEYNDLVVAAKLEWLKDQYGDDGWRFIATPFGFAGTQERSGAFTGRQMTFDTELNQVGYYSLSRQWRVESREDGSVWKVGKHLDTGKLIQEQLVEPEATRNQRRFWAFNESIAQGRQDSARLASLLAVEEGVEQLLDISVRVGSGGAGIVLIDAPEAITGKSMTKADTSLSMQDRILAGLPVGVVTARRGKRLYTVVENAVRGGSFERAAMRTLEEDLPGVQKNWMTVFAIIEFKGKKIPWASIPDVLISKKAVIEIKYAKEVYLGRQILTQIAYAKNAKLPYRLIVAPRSRVTQQVLDAVQAIGGRVEVYDRNLKEFRQYVP